MTYLPKAGKPTQADLVRLAVAREYDIRECNADKTAIRAWYDSYCKSKGMGCKVRYGSEK